MRRRMMVSDELKMHFPTEIVQEGQVRVLAPKLSALVRQPSDYAPSRAPVFYNPIMELNRDIAVIAFQAYQRAINRRITLCEPLTSTGIRGIRFAAEIHGANGVLIGDISERAVELARYNIILNGLQHCLTVQHKDANLLLSEHAAPHRRFDVVDLDPFGSPVPYLDSAIRALRDEGLLAVTATDLAPLCGVHPKACVRKYGGKPLRTEYCHELAVRLLAGCIVAVAAKHDIGIHVVFSHSTDHYIRVYAQIAYGAKRADAAVKSLGYILHCFNCLHRESAKSPFAKDAACPECGSKMDYAGPLWLEKIFDKGFCKLMAKENMQRALRNSGKIARLLALAETEAEAPATYYVLDRISDKLALPVPAVDTMLQVLRSSGFIAVPTHFNSRGIRTNASALVVKKLLQRLAAT
ncbi:MAG: tRNA (guanine(10)-N(2))-dimethyltransferase [Candidatus Bathyarchaeota archaeon]|nr:tRNA (guanine(10)-N(2))-dimethyltransferase [Candidatus Bathyarchaeota archaeon]